MCGIATDSACLHVAGIVEESCVDGPGLRMAVFAQGCPHHCPGCHNPQTHSFTGGQIMPVHEIVSLYEQNPLLAGLTCTGGEPFCQPLAFASLAQMIHARGGDVITYTGYLFENLRNMRDKPGVLALLEETDFLVDGPFMQEQANAEMPFMGSANQRFLDLRALQNL